MTGVLKPAGIFLDAFRALRFIAEKVCDTNYGVHRRADIVRHVRQKRGFCFVRDFRGAARVFDFSVRLAELFVFGFQYGIKLLHAARVVPLCPERFLLLAPQHQVYESHAQHQHYPCERHDYRTGCVHEVDRIYRHIRRRYKEHQRPVCRIQATERVIVFLAVQDCVGIRDAI